MMQFCYNFLLCFLKLLFVNILHEKLSSALQNTKIVLTHDVCYLAALDIADLDYTFSDFSL